MTAPKCERCGEKITAEEQKMGWPVEVATPEGEDPTKDTQQICPACCGDDSWCREGHLLRGNSNSEYCYQCRFEDLTSHLASYNHGDGCLEIIVRQALDDDPNVTADEIEEICREAEEYAKAEKEWDTTRRPGELA